jgi:hypothetical protein
LFSTVEDAKSFATTFAKDVQPEDLQNIVTALAGCNFTKLIEAIQFALDEANFSLTILGKLIFSTNKTANETQTIGEEIHD